MNRQQIFANTLPLSTQATTVTLRCRLRIDVSSSNSTRDGRARQRSTTRAASDTRQVHDPDATPPHEGGTLPESISPAQPVSAQGQLSGRSPYGGCRYPRGVGRSVGLDTNSAGTGSADGAQAAPRADLRSRLPYVELRVSAREASPRRHSRDSPFHHQTIEGSNGSSREISPPCFDHVDHQVLMRLKQTAGPEPQDSEPDPSVPPGRCDQRTWWLRSDSYRHAARWDHLTVAGQHLPFGTRQTFRPVLGDRHEPSLASSTSTASGLAEIGELLAAQ